MRTTYLLQTEILAVIRRQMGKRTIVTIPKGSTVALVDTAPGDDRLVQIQWNDLGGDVFACDLRVRGSRVDHSADVS